MSTFINENPNSNFPGIEMYRGGLLPGYSPEWSRKPSGELDLSKGYQTSTNPKTHVTPAVTFYAHCSIPEGSTDPTVYPGFVEFWQKSGVDVYFCPEEQKIIIEVFGIFTKEDLAGNIDFIKKRFLDETFKKFDGCTYTHPRLPMKVLLDRAFK